MYHSPEDWDAMDLKRKIALLYEMEREESRRSMRTAKIELCIYLVTLAITVGVALWLW